MAQVAFVCSKQSPWTPRMRHAVVLHPEAHVTDAAQGEQAMHIGPNGQVLDIRCPNCGFEWTRDVSDLDLGGCA
jgi:hypothetical protein